ncbi:Methionine aminopeptidase 1 [bioreactor metagenome]|jgi:methionyl aminopeptidase|uniref:Methionine aminopeptidase n=2 Tax=root TaxID=1 RepID=A0A652ZUJ2_9SPIR|nr:type I methionyl aminopeptidase [Spirochaetales bacterium]NLX45423.1 type I methionyl aminopeptidase [Treponema sp.]VBB39433.1 Methionine aminopeptidase [uncultured Spirochaetota bacterium]HOI23050.1 type I methionyl aminopeptidase [Spirochaetales bacterium]
MIRRKNNEQIEGIRKSCSLLSRLLTEIRPLVQPGASLLELDRFARDFILRHGGRPAFLGYEGYPATLCLSVNEVVIHGIPDERRLAEGDIVGLDSGIDLGGYFSDAAVTWAVGRVGPEAERLMRVTRECLDKAIEAVVPGARIHDISRAVFRQATGAGFGVVRQYCGHGVGLEMHEDPQIPNYVSPGPNPRLLPGMVLAIEPMINAGTGDVRLLDDDWTVVTLDGSLSAHYEHTVLVTETGHEVLTSWRF